MQPARFALLPALALSGCAACSDPVPDGFRDLAAHFAAADRARWDLSWHDPSRGMTERGTLTLGPGRGGRLEAPDRGVVVIWEDNLMTASFDEGDVPVPSLVPYADDVAGSLRAGFSDSRWVAADHPPMGLEVQGRRWSTVAMPHDWATDLRIWFAVDGAGELTHMVIEDQTPPLEAEVIVLGGRRQTVTLSESGKLLVSVEASHWGP